MIKDLIQQANDVWADPARRKLVMYAIAAALLTIMWFSMGGSGDSEKSSAQKSYKTKEGSVLGINNSADAIGQTDANEVIKELTETFNQKEKDLESRESRVNKSIEGLVAEMQKLKQDQFQTNESIKALSQLASKELQADRMTAGSSQYSPTLAKVGGEKQALNVLDAQGNILQRRQTQIVTSQQPPIEGKMIRTITQRNVRVVRESGKIEQQDVKTTNISQRTQNVIKDKVANKPADVNKSVNGGNEGEFALTMGSIITGVLINGVYAPTSTNGQKDPMPVLMRVKKEAIMPNNFTLDVRECHMLGSAIGDLATERAQIRAEAISCITEAGQSIEKNITAYAVSSEDGNAGIPGDVVFKSGTMIANSLKADFLANFGKAIAPQRVQSLNTSPGDTQLWQQQNVNYAATSGIAGGIGGSADRLAQYYLQMAENAHPTIEILPGIEVDFIVQKGMTMKLEAPTDAGPSKDNSATIQTQNSTASTSVGALSNNTN